MNRKAVQKLQQMIDWSDRLGSDEINEIQDVILLLKLENSTIDIIKDLRKYLKNKLVSTEEVMNLINNDIEYLETSEKDELACITIENLEGILNRYFNKK